MRISDKFRELEGSGALIAYICAGDPDTGSCLDACRQIIGAGADILELGLPFSDPMADGPTIQAASQRALDAGMNTDKYFGLAGKVHHIKDIPLVCMTYYNLLLQYGLDRFAGRCVESGITGLIIPDLPLEEARPLLAACKGKGIDVIFLVAQTTTDERMERILEVAKGFVYVVALLGTTGERDEVSDMLKPLLVRVRAKTSLPLAVGFGIAGPEHVRKVMGLGADAVIVGSAIIKRLAGGKPVGEFVRSLKDASSK
ncbi:tryptophan synthase subunit alpha [Candidatus Altiarchaeota archaeon]